MLLKFLGAAGTVTGSRYLLDCNDKRLLIDCGLFQGHKANRLRNWAQFPVPPQSIEAVLLTHAHIDHTGYLPLLVKNGFKGTIYATEATFALCGVLLRDSAHLQEEDARRANKYGYSRHHPALPLYTMEDAKRALKQFKVIEYDKHYAIIPGGEISWHRAGHILGAAMVRLQFEGRTTLFSGDLGRADDPILKPPALMQEADYLVIESTYGDRLHGKSTPEEQLASIITDTCKHGGTVLIPTFAVGRAQNLLYYLHKLKEIDAIPDVPIFLDSPMAASATKIFQRYAHEHNLSQKHADAICNSVKVVNTPEESRALDENPMTKIILSASGMATGGRVLHHLKVFAPDPKHSIVFAGYQVPGTRGAKIVAGNTEIKIHGEYYPVRAHVHALENISAHADYAEVLTWLRHLQKPPIKVFITHGERSAAVSLKEKIETRFHFNCVIPDYLDEEALV